MFLGRKNQYCENDYTTKCNLQIQMQCLMHCKEIQPIHPKGDQSWVSGLMLRLKLQYFGHLMQRANSLEKTLMLGGIRGRRRRG